MYIKNKKDFLFESYILKLINEKYLNFSDRFNNILYSNPLNPIFFEIIKNREVTSSKVDFIDIDPDLESIRFLTDKSNVDYVDYSSKYTNTSMKIGRFLRMLYTELTKKTPLDKDIEEAVNIIKSNLSSDKLEIVEGEEIRNCYLEKNYLNDKGTLGSSCMRFESKSILFDVYVENCKLLILKKDGKVTGRAIIWTLDDGKIFLDRIYTNTDSDVIRFKKYAIDNKYLSKKKQDFNNISNIEDHNGNAYNDILEIIIGKIYEFYPYMDTMKFLDNKGTLRSKHTTDDIKLSLEGNEVAYSKYEDRVLFLSNTIMSNKFGILSRYTSTYRNGDYYPNAELVMDVSGGLDLKENLAYNEEFDYYYDKNSKLVDVDFFGRKIKMPDDSNNIISLGSFTKKYYWQFSIVEIEHEFYKNIPSDLKRKYLDIVKEIEERKESSFYKLAMKYSHIFKLGKLKNKEHTEFLSIVGDLSENINDHSDHSYFLIRDFIKIYFFRKFNEINYPNVVNKKKFKLFGEGYTFEDFTLDDMEYVKELYLDGLTDINQLSNECDIDIEVVKQIISVLKERGDIDED